MILRLWICEGKPWTVEEEQQLRDLAAAKKPIGVIAGALGKSDESVRLKVKCSGLVEVEQANFQWSTSSNQRRRIFARVGSSETPIFLALTDSGVFASRRSLSASSILGNSSGKTKLVEVVVVHPDFIFYRGRLLLI